MLLLLFARCEKVIDPKNLPEQDPRLVLNCVMHTDSVALVQISSSRAVLSGKDYKLIDNAVCDLYSDGVFIEKLQGIGKGKYLSTKPPQKKRNYAIHVAATGFDPIDAGTQMPDTVNLISVTRMDSAHYHFYKMNNGTGFLQLGGSARFRIRLRDNIDEENYYGLSLRAVFIDSTGTELEDLDDQAVSIQHLNALSNQEKYYGSSLETDDQNLVNGDEKWIDVELSVYSSETEAWGLRLYMSFNSFSKDYFKYAKTARQQSSNAGNPFSEPTQVYSNVSSGMGLLGGRTGFEAPILDEKLLKQ